MNKLAEKSGFTLIETLVAIMVLTIAVFSLYSMQTTAIRGNATANSLTIASNWARDRVEKLLAKDYTDPELADGNGTTDGCAGLDDWPNSDGMDNDDAIYKIYWNVANDCTMTDIPSAAKPEEEQKPKHIRVIVTRENLGIQKTLVFNYIKQNTI